MMALRAPCHHQRHLGRCRGPGQMWIPGVVLWIVGQRWRFGGARRSAVHAGLARHIKHRPLLDVRECHAEPVANRQRPALLATGCPGPGWLPGVVLKRMARSSARRAFVVLTSTVPRRRADLYVSTIEQRVAQAGFGLALFISRAGPPPTTRTRVSRAAVVAGRRGTPRRLPGLGQPLRERLPPDADVSAARGGTRGPALREPSDRRRGLARAPTAFVAETDRIFDLLDGVMPEIAWLDDSQTLTYLHSTISTRCYRVGVPEVPFHLDALLADSALIGAGAHAGRSAPARGDGAASRPRPGRGFWMTSTASALRIAGQPGSCASTKPMRKRSFPPAPPMVRQAQERHRIAARNHLPGNPAGRYRREQKSADADAALQELGSDKWPFGYVTTTVTVLDADRRRPMRSCAWWNASSRRGL